TISIHAPARGATLTCSEAQHRKLISIHAPARGATMSRINILQVHQQFQSTLPRGERRSVEYASGANYTAFQSTLPRGERPRLRSMITLGAEISIHAPARGATGYSFYGTGAICISIHAPARGATCCRRDHDCTQHQI